MALDMDIAFLGGLFPRETEGEILEKSIGAVQAAANALQWNLVEGLDAHLERPVKVINSLYIGAFPGKYRDLWIPSYSFQHAPGAEDLNVGFLNLFGVKQYWKYWSLKPRIKRWAREQGKQKAIIAYAMTGVFAKCLRYAKKINPKVQTCMIVPDLPEYMNTTNKSSRLYQFLKNMEIRQIENSRKWIDGYVLLTEQMKNYLGITGKYTVVEGVSADPGPCEEEAAPPAVLYSGSLHEQYGVLQLVEAFRMVQGEYRLLLCGAGDAQDKIRAAAKEDPRIEYRGQLPRDEVLCLQRRAAVLVNPRRNIGEYTKYSFPSKLTEYLASGVPVAAYRLDGMPEEYEGYITYVPGDSPQELADTLERLLRLSPQARRDMGGRAREWVLREKGRKPQAGKILAMLLADFETKPFQ